MHEYVTIPELAELTGVTVDAVHKWRLRFDDFPETVYVSRTPTWPLAEVRRWLAAHPRLGQARTRN